MTIKSRGVQGFLDTIMEKTPNGESILVQYHPNGDWSVSNEPQVIYGDADDIELTDAEFEQFVDLGQSVASHLQSEHATGGYSVDTGIGGGEYEAFIEVGDVEYKVLVRPYCRVSELDAELATIPAA